MTHVRCTRKMSLKTWSGLYTRYGVRQSTSKDGSVCRATSIISLKALCLLRATNSLNVETCLLGWKDRPLAKKLNKIAMNGREVYKYATRVLPEVMLEALAANGLKPGAIDHVISHQANIRIVESVIDRLGIPREKCWLNIDRYGNTSSASLPISLDEAARAGQLKEGELVAMMAIGAGMAWGSALLRW